MVSQNICCESKMFRPLTEDCSRTGSRKIMNIINSIEAETPFTAYGFFSIEPSTLTSIGLGILTYLVILIQFDDGKNK